MFGIAKIFVVAVLSALLASALTVSTRAQSAMILAVMGAKPHTTDLDDMLARWVVWILVPYSKTYFFIDRGDFRGIDAELGLELQTWLNTRYRQTGAYRRCPRCLAEHPIEFEYVRDVLADLVACTVA